MTDKQQPNIFKNGMEFLFPTSNHGPSLYGIMEGMWLNVMLIQGIRQRIWETAQVGNPDAVAAAWAAAGLLTVTGGEEAPQVVLTEAGQNVIACAGLLEYEFNMASHQLTGNSETDPAMYTKLRGGLSAYAEKFLPEMLEWVGGFAAQLANPIMLDYCGGAGTYAKAVNRATEGRAVTWMADKAVSPEVREELVNGHGVTIREGDVLSGVLDDLGEFFDLIVASEILHCKGAAERNQMLADMYRMLRPGGMLIVIEQFPTRRLEWRMEMMTAEGQTLRPEQVAFEVQAFALAPVGHIECVSHYGTAFVKGDVK